MNSAPLATDQARFLGSIREAVREAFPLVLPYSDEDDAGGFFSLRQLFHDWLIEKMLLGFVPPKKVEKHSYFSMEKPLRLEEHQHELKPHLSSFQSRHAHMNMRGGATIGYDVTGLVPTYAFGFSGLTEACDETINLLTEIKVGCLTVNRACFIAGISKNFTFYEILTIIQADQSNYFHCACT